jgi:hypothetical protein
MEEVFEEKGLIFAENWEWWEKQLDQFKRNNSYLKKIND